jgi:hypothetical protein
MIVIEFLSNKLTKLALILVGAYFLFKAVQLIVIVVSYVIVSFGYLIHNLFTNHTAGETLEV